MPSQGLKSLCKGLNQALHSPFSGPIARSQITTIDALSCFGQLTSLVELTLDLLYCEGLTDLGPLSSMGACINLLKLNLKLGGLYKAGTLSRTSIWGPNKAS